MKLQLLNMQEQHKDNFKILVQHLSENINKLFKVKALKYRDISFSR